MTSFARGCGRWASRNIVLRWRAVRYALNSSAFAQALMHRTGAAGSEWYIYDVGGSRSMVSSAAFSSLPNAINTPLTAPALDSIFRRCAGDHLPRTARVQSHARRRCQSQPSRMYLDCGISPRGLQLTAGNYRKTRSCCGERSVATNCWRAQL